MEQERRPGQFRPLFIDSRQTAVDGQPMQDVLETAAVIKAAHNTTPEWRQSAASVDYPAAVAAMENRVAAIFAGDAPEVVWLLQHPALYTAGTSAKPQDLLRHDLPVYQTGRGGQYTWHGPGQRVAYVLCDLRQRDNDLRRYVHDLESWLIAALAQLGVAGERREGRVGIWVVKADGREAKIAALGVRVRRGIAYHGVSVNVDPDLSAFDGIVPCGIAQHGVTSLRDMGVAADMAALDAALRAAWLKVMSS